MTFAATLLAVHSAMADGMRPLASEAAAAVLLDRAGVTPADVEVGRVIVYAEGDDVRDAVRLLAYRVWRDQYAPATHLEVAEVEKGKRLVCADEGDLFDVGDWMGVAGERGCGVLMIVRSPDNAHEAYRLWASKTARLDPIDADGVVYDVVQLVTGQRPMRRSNLRDVRLSDLRSALGPRDLCDRAMDVIVDLRDQRAREIKADEDKLAVKAAEAAAAERAAFDKARSGEPVHERDTPLSRLSGFGKAKAWGLEVAADLRAYRQGELAWADCDRGVLLSGPPGVGKTRFARALAAEAGVPFHASSFSAICGGSSSGYNIEKGLKKLFDDARKNVPCIVFLDEMDSVPGRDFKPDHNSSYFNSVNNAFLEALDGATPRDGIVVIAASNFPERIDPALKRPGRLDREIAIPMPTVDDLAGIVAHHLGSDTSSMQEQLRLAAKACRGMSPADVEQACRDARRRARKVLGRSSVLPGDVAWVVRERRGKVDPRTERLVAVHEAGHAVAAVALGIEMDFVDADRARTSIRSAANPTADMMETEIVMTLAGRAAEAIVIGEVTTGAKLDIQSATKAAIAYHADFGFGEATGLLSLDVRALEGWGPLHDGVKALVNRCHDRALALIRMHRRNVEAVAAALERDRYLDREEVLAIMRPTLSVLRSAPDEVDSIPDQAPSWPRVGNGWQRRAA
ncbi:AAA family ATPase [Lichenihabitans sp. Uapishka_5]|uniref:AAA family ATPase n=1 Tax=Lichenihabitans sp. Uapishka_5 TaxID=3037302 RepID=UPI0029E80AD7|nr:AAA family ATPase [Lichenihabitans sp. Uapishka_5]MDX7952291.1 AAA family ATPase [Lichenihabitans sp. Uapishka_5]